MLRDDGSWESNSNTGRALIAHIQTCRSCKQSSALMWDPLTHQTTLGQHSSKSAGFSYMTLLQKSGCPNAASEHVKVFLGPLSQF